MKRSTLKWTARNFKRYRLHLEDSGLPDTLAAAFASIERPRTAPDAPQPLGQGVETDADCWHVVNGISQK